MSDCLVCRDEFSGGETRAQVCSICISRLRKALEALPRLYVELYVEPLSGRRWATERLEGPRAWKYRRNPDPLSLDLIDHAELCVDAVFEWAANTLPGCLIHAPAAAGPLLQHLCRSLSRNLSHAVSSIQDGTYARKVCFAHERACRLLGQEEMYERLETPCPSCSLRSAFSKGDGETICNSCGSQWQTNSR